MAEKILPAQVTLNALRDGQVMNELAQHIHDASCAMLQHGKAASVTLTLTFKPTEGVSQGLKNAPMLVTAEVTSKLPKTPPPDTLMFADADGNPTRQAPAREPELGFHVTNIDEGRQKP